MPDTNTTTIPAVPRRTQMYDDNGNMTRTWVIFFEQLSTAVSGIGGPGAGSAY